ncbi:unnamed protein product, partial [Prorocentrum cordatum]
MGWPLGSGPARRDCSYRGVGRTALACFVEDLCCPFSAAATADVTLSAGTDDALKADRAFVSAAVAKDWHALQYADALFCRDEDVALVAAQDEHALEYADSDRDVVLAAVAEAGEALQYADASLRRAEGVVQAAVAQDERALAFAADSGFSRRPSLGAGVLYCATTQASGPTGACFFLAG